MYAARKTVGVSRVFLHPDFDYNSGRPWNDIAMLKLDREVDLSVYTPICLPPTGEDYTGKTAVLAGKILLGQT